MFRKAIIMPVRIFYGVAGEGLGHASRLLSVIGHLPECEIHVFTFGKAYDFFASQDYPHLHEIDGLLFEYRQGSVNYLRTLWKSCRFYVSGLKRNIQYIVEQAQKLQPDLFITDFEPSVIRAAHRLKQTVLSIDNQHKFVDCRADSLPPFLKLYACLTGISVKLMIPSPIRSVVATFHADRLQKRHNRVTLTGGILRKEVEEQPIANKGFILVYLRQSVGEAIAASLAGCGREVRVYGAGEEIRTRYRGQMKFFDLSPKFVEELAACDKVISTAGNQLISECRYFGKPILTIPEPGQYEQAVNAHFVEEIGLGRSCAVKKLTPEVIQDFISSFQCQSERIPNGIFEVIRVIREQLSTVLSVEPQLKSGDDVVEVNRTLRNRGHALKTI
jgi:uncharacterized protein (TIGR00661 family)